MFLVSNSPQISKIHDLTVMEQGGSAPVEQLRKKGRKEVCGSH